jgi:DNA excision repair protein ERCC-2
LQAKLDAGVYTLHDLRTLCRKEDKHWCPYYLARHMLAFANVIVYNYQYMLDPKACRRASPPLTLTLRDVPDPSMVLMHITALRDRLAYSHPAVESNSACLESCSRLQVSQMVSRELEKECVVVFDEAHNIDNVCIEASARPSWHRASIGKFAALVIRMRT